MMQICGRRADAGKAEHRTKGSDEAMLPNTNHRRFRPRFSNIPDAMGGTGIPAGLNGKIQSLSQQNGKIATALPEGGETGHSRESDGI